MKDILESIPKGLQRQDSLSDQLADLRMVANKLGMYDAADAIGQWCDHLPKLNYGCHCEVDVGEEPADDCVIDSGMLGDCIYAEKGMRKEQCEYWRIIK